MNLQADKRRIFLFHFKIETRLSGQQIIPLKMLKILHIHAAIVLLQQARANCSLQIHMKLLRLGFVRCKLCKGQ